MKHTVKITGDIKQKISNTIFIEYRYLTRFLMFFSLFVFCYFASLVLIQLFLLFTVLYPLFTNLIIPL